MSINQKTLNPEAYTNQQLLSSLVINAPYTIDRFTTAPQVSKLFTLPLGIQVNSATLFKSLFNVLVSICLIMLLVCITTFSIYLPIQNQNIQMLNSAKSMGNQQLALKVKLQETTSYNKLLSQASILSLKDAEDIVHLGNGLIKGIKYSKLVVVNQYPSILFSGF